MNYKSIVLFIAFISLFFTHSSFAEVGNISNQEMKTMMGENVPIIDIRRLDEWKSTGVIKGSHKMTFFDARGQYNMKKWLAELDKIAGKNDPFILVCRTGNRTGDVSNYLDKKLGYTKVYHLKKGIVNWIKSGDKVVFEQ